MARYRKIDTRTWFDAKFRALWEARWHAPSRVPKSHPYPFKGWADPREGQCLSMRHRFKKLRIQLLARAIERHGNRCNSCRDKGPLFPDHIIPICYGGTNDEVNIQPLCESCNSAKGGRLPSPPERG